jgi:maltose 6'-phosphate phosphatase
MLSIVHEQTGDVVIPVRREVSMARIHLPDIGDVNVYNTHLCAGCEPAERLHQVEVLLAFVDDMERRFGDNQTFILGGDFNIDASLPDEASRRAYDLLTAELLDTYSFVNGCVRCCVELDLEDVRGCTINLPGNPFGAGAPQRIDYLLIRDGPWIPVASQVVFNGLTPDDWVSDHSGVLTTLDVKGENAPLLSSR